LSRRNATFFDNNLFRLKSKYVNNPLSERDKELVMHVGIPSMPIVIESMPIVIAITKIKSQWWRLINNYHC